MIIMKDLFHPEKHYLIKLSSKRRNLLKYFSHLFSYRNDTTNVLSDIDSMLSDLNRELDQMLDYEPTPSSTRS